MEVKPIEIRAEIPDEDLAELSEQPVDRLAIDVIPAYVTIRLNGKSPFTTPQGLERSVYVVIIEFLQDLAEALNGLKRGEARDAKVFLTGTLYALHIRRKGQDYDIDVYEHDRKTSRLLASARVPISELVGESRAVIDATLTSLSTANPRLGETEELVTLRELAAALPSDRTRY